RPGNTSWPSLVWMKWSIATLPSTGYICRRLSVFLIEDFLQEPYRSQFIQLLREGAGNLDMHDALEKKHFAVGSPATEEWIQAEMGRVAVHQRRQCPLLEEYVGKVDKILDVGCG